MSNTPRFILAGLSGGTGKTIVSLALARALSRDGLRVAPFKKGPDYIDAKWLGLSAGRPCSNLDPFFHDEGTIRSLLLHRAEGCDISLIEGNRGLFDGMDEYGTCSTAELSRILQAPVILTIDCTKMTRTVAAIVKGCEMLEPGFHLAGVILNRTAGERHREVLRKSIETHTDVPVLGMLPKIKENPIPERHMGLVSDQEYDQSAFDSNQQALDSLADLAEEWLDIEAIKAVSETAPPMEGDFTPIFSGPAMPKTVKIGYVHDAALWFYYPENLEALEHHGAELVRLSVLTDDAWPDLDGLYLGGGFPEVFADRISSNGPVLSAIKSASEAGMPIYAECGGFMILCKYLERDGRRFDMADVFPVGTTFCPKPQGLGYTRCIAGRESAFYPEGAAILGHEFHYSVCLDGEGHDMELCPTLRMVRGKGVLNGKDGLTFKNTYAGYNHIHALAVPGWARRFVAAAQQYAEKS